MTARRQGFSMVELLVLIGILVVLLAIALPAILRARGAYDRIACANNMRQLGHAIHLYHGDYGRMPPHMGATQALRHSKSDPCFVLSWRALLLPYCEENQLWTQAVTACEMEQLSYLPPHEGYHTVVKLLGCPSDERVASAHLVEGRLTAFTSYLGVRGGVRSDGMFGYLLDEAGTAFASVTDGLSNTIMIGERPPPRALNAGQWYSSYLTGKTSLANGPNDRLLMAEPGANETRDVCNRTYYYGRGSIDNTCDRFHFWSLHPGGANFTFGDASVRFLSYDIGIITSLALASRNGGEVIDASDY